MCDLSTGLVILFFFIFIILSVFVVVSFSECNSYIKQVSDLKNESKLKDIEIAILLDSNNSERKYLAKKFK